MNWLQSNSAAIQEIASGLTLIVTILWLLISRRSLRVVRETGRPRLLIDSEQTVFGGPVVYITNFGDRPATSVRIARLTCSDVQFAEQLQSLPAFRVGVEFLAPGSRIVLAPRAERAAEPGRFNSLAVSIEIEYRDGGTGFKYSDSLKIDSLQRSLVERADDAAATWKIEAALRQVVNALRPDLDPVRSLNRKKACPACAEWIPPTARKCSHCHENTGWQVDRPAEASE